MYPTLSHFIKDIFGVNIPLPVQSYGLLVAIALITAAYIYYLEYKRKEKEGLLIPFFRVEKEGEPISKKDLILKGVVWFLLGFKIAEAALNYSDFVDNPQAMLLSKRGSVEGGILFAVAAVIYNIVMSKKKELPEVKYNVKQVYPHQIVGNMLIFVGIWGIIGAKVFDAIQPNNFAIFIKDPIGTLLSFSGLTFLGGLIAGFIAGVLYLRRYNINLIHSIDAFAPAAALGYAIGRLGCQISGDGCWGAVNMASKPAFLPQWFWAYDFPQNVLNKGVPIEGLNDKFYHVLQNPVYPTSLYEFTIMLLAFVILWSIRKKLKTPGFLVSIYLILAGLERFFIEFIRVTDPYESIGLTQAQIIALLMVTGGMGLIIYIFKNKQKFVEFGKTIPKDINDKDKTLKKEMNKNK